MPPIENVLVRYDIPVLRPYLGIPGPWYAPHGRDPFVSPAEAARHLGVPVKFVSNLNDNEAVAILDAHGPEVCVLSGVGLLAEPQRVLSPLGMINAHSGMLPEYRGLDAVAWSMLEGFPIGCTVHAVDGGVDTGSVFSAYDLSAVECANGVKRSLRQAKLSLLRGTLHALGRGNGSVRRQRDSDGRRFYRMHPLLRAILAKWYRQFGVAAFAGNIRP
ncbi:MAG: hypothetical protein HYR85_21150 [Planctomycetes bacterium]|nr:hypothetical protein [Planctomycetota bacterium]MBI3843280.1 hypothetical protein [Planctomycetota bacterium]